MLIIAMVIYTISSCYGNVAMDIVTIVIVVIKIHIVTIVTVGMVSYVM